MKVGDLVALSSRGSKIKNNGHALNKVGVIVEVYSRKSHMYPIIVNWLGGRAGAMHQRKDVKYISKVK